MTKKEVSIRKELENAMAERGLSASEDVSSFVVMFVLSKFESMANSMELLATQSAKTNEMLLSLQEELKNANETLCVLRAENAVLKEELEKYKARNNRNSSNSNLPPSSDMFSKKKPSPRPSEIYAGDAPKKKSGGQHGHSGTTMKVKDTPDKSVRIYPAACTTCPSFEKCKEKAREGIKRTVIDVEVRTIQTEYVQMCMSCACGGSKVGVFPSYVNAPLQYGPMVKAIVTDLSADGAVSMDRLEKFMNSLFALDLTDATISNIIEKGSKLCETFMDSAKNHLASQSVVHFDETGGRFGGRNAWIHIAADKNFAVYGFSKKRGKEGIDKLGVYRKMAKPGQVAVSDFWGAYLTIDKETGNNVSHAFCGAHIDRELQNLIDNYDSPACARKMKKLLKYAYIEVQKAKDRKESKLPDKILDEINKRYDKIVKAALNKYKPEKRTEGKRGKLKKGKILALCERFCKYKHGILMFANNFNVPFSNNCSEVLARKVKAKLKISGCFRSARGADAFCNIKSLLESARKQNQNVFEVLYDLFAGKNVLSHFSF